MADSILNNQFDMEKYINERLLEVKGLEERVVLKEILNNLFLELYSNVEKQYLDLEKRIFEEAMEEVQQPVIITGLLDKKHYDKTEQDLVPMKIEDLEDIQIDVQALQESIQANVPFFIYTIFIENDYLKLKELMKKERIFRGTVKTEYGEYKATFLVKKNTSYLKKIEQVYEAFLNNYMTWHTVCTPYLHKLFDVYIMQIDQWNQQDEILEARVDFEEYAQSIKYDVFPVWNMTMIEEKTSTFPEACVDHIYYEHVIFKNCLEEGKVYLVANTEVEIANIRKVDGDLHITCNRPNTQRWLFYVINPVSSKKRSFPLMDNQVSRTFSSHVRDSYQRQIKTKTELIRYLISLGYTEYVRVKEIDILQDPFMNKETYQMDAFIQDEMRLEKQTGQLVVKFEAIKRENFLTRDVMSYLVSSISHLYPEYECLGQLV